MLEAGTSRTYMDFAQFAAMRKDAKSEPNESLEEVAKQFESIFVNMMLKSMRDASFGDPLFDSSQTEFFREMQDKQLALDMTKGNGIGLATALVSQMQQYIPHTDNKNTTDVMNKKVSDPFVGERSLNDFNSKQEFIETMMPLAEAAAEKLGVDPKVLVAQSALETGWGKSIGKNSNGESSFNLFNIKAQAGYQGNAYAKKTVEYGNGIAKLENASFREYSSYEESFDDYVSFIKNGLRYQDALQNASTPGAYINGIHQAGYATDPKYADKIERIVSTMPVDESFESDDYG